MPYDLMLLADPGPERARVLSALRDAPDIRPDAELENRFWLSTAPGEAQLNCGTKDPVESVHVEIEPASPALLEAVTLRALELAADLGMYIEDVQWGHEITRESLPRVREFWRSTSPAEIRPQRIRPRAWWQLWS